MKEEQIAVRSTTTPPPPDPKYDKASSPSNHPPLSLGVYSRRAVTNVDDEDDPAGRRHFDEGLRLLLSYFHEEASLQFLACTVRRPHCALAHALVALCHGPNYNFTGEEYYAASHSLDNNGDGDGDGDGDARRNCLKNSNHTNDDDGDDEDAAIDDDRDGSCSFPCQVIAEYHSALAVGIVRDVEKMYGEQQFDEDTEHTGRASEEDGTLTERRKDDGITDSNLVEQHEQHKQHKHRRPHKITDLETQLIFAVRTLTEQPGIHPSLATASVSRPYADALKSIYRQHPSDPEVAYLYAESLMALNAWNLYEYPSGRPLSDDTLEVRTVLENALEGTPDHAGLCHMYVHLCEMSEKPEDALGACEVLRTRFQDAGHLIHMSTHIYILLGDYEACVKYNKAAIRANTTTTKLFPKTASATSFFFYYIAHDYHMLIYGAILGAMEHEALSCAQNLTAHLPERLFLDNPRITPYLEGYATMDVHVLVRFGRWREILALDLPLRPDVMVYRAAALRYARALAYVNLGEDGGGAAEVEAAEFERIRSQRDVTSVRYLHNNSIADMLDVNSLMMKGETEYFRGRCGAAFDLLREAVSLQDDLNFDEPWGVMQPVRHALGGLLLREGVIEEAECVFRADLSRHPNNPWASVGLVSCLEEKRKRLDDDDDRGRVERRSIEEECEKIRVAFREQRKSKWADFDVTCSCMCVKGKCCTD